MPEPSCVRPLVLSTRWNRSKSRGISSCGNAHPGIRHFEHDVGCLAPQAHGDGAVERELKGVREQVEYDFLPHLPIEKHRLIDRLAIDLECESGGFDRRTEIARKIASKHRRIDGFKRGLQPAGLDAREVEQRVHQLQEPQ